MTTVLLECDGSRPILNCQQQPCVSLGSAYHGKNRDIVNATFMQGSQKRGADSGLAGARDAG